MYQCYRWLLCSFKRELSFDQTLQLWENLWTDHLGPNFHLFVALAILEAHRDVMIRYLREFDEVSQRSRARCERGTLQQVIELTVFFSLSVFDPLTTRSSNMSRNCPRPSTLKRSWPTPKFCTLHSAKWSNHATPNGSVRKSRPHRTVEHRLFDNGDERLARQQLLLLVLLLLIRHNDRVKGRLRRTMRIDTIGSKLYCRRLCLILMMN